MWPGGPGPAWWGSACAPQGWGGAGEQGVSCEMNGVDLLSLPVRDLTILGNWDYM